MGIHELLVASDDDEADDPEARAVEEMRKQAVAEGMTTLLQDGIIKVLRGQTDFQQVRAVCIK
jgi:type II secretory ATPase GspE/PulE/Tfp pilus assembly ATPase PilB-like protein